uniref:Uncharacterized protein n=1 Tax=Schistosoma curassoni TaxID=6186 RepID=A0A183K4V7_9TREM
MYQHLVDVHFETRTQYHSLQTPWLAVGFRMHVSFYLRLVRWMYLHPIIDFHYGTRTQYLTAESWLAVESRTCVPSYLGLVSWIYLLLIVAVNSGTRTQYHSLQTLSRYPLGY